MDNRDATETRRRFIALVGGGAVLLPFVGLAGCGSDEEARAPAANSDSGSTSKMGSDQSQAKQSTTDKASERAAGQQSAGEQAPADDAQAGSREVGGDGSKPKVSEDDPQAKNLAYVHDADDVIASEQPRYEEGQDCSNCQLYQGTADDEWAGCPLFTGKLVKGTGWCNAYAPKSG